MQNIMLMKMPIILAFIFLLIVSPVIAVDESGQYIYGGAVGGHSCPFFASIMVKANKYNIPSPEYAFQTSSHTNYISGFQKVSVERSILQTNTYLYALLVLSELQNINCLIGCIIIAERTL